MHIHAQTVAGVWKQVCYDHLDTLKKGPAGRIIGRETDLHMVTFVSVYFASMSQKRYVVHWSFSEFMFYKDERFTGAVSLWKKVSFQHKFFYL